MLVVAVVSENITSDDSEGYYPTSADDLKSGKLVDMLPMQVVKVVLLHGTATIMLTVMVQHTRVRLTDICTTSGETGQVVHKTHQVTLLIVYYPEEFGFRWGEISEDYNPRSGSYPYHYWGTVRPPTMDGALSLSLLKDTLEEAITTYVLIEHPAIRTVLETALE